MVVLDVFVVVVDVVAVTLSVTVSVMLEAGRVDVVEIVTVTVVDGAAAVYVTGVTLRQVMQAEEYFAKEEQADA